MDKCEYLDLLVNGVPLASFDGSTMLDFKVGETPLTADVFQGVNRTSWHLLKTRFGLRTISLIILFRGKTLHAAKLQRSRFNGLISRGKVELYIPADGFYYDCYTASMGAEEVVGIGDTDAAVQASYAFTGIRRDALRSETLPAGATMYCLSTMPYTDCRLSAVMPADPGLPVLNKSGSTITFNNSTGYYFANPFTVSIPAATTGETAITLTQTATGQDTRTTTIQLGKTVYGGNVEAISGTLTETHTSTTYDPENIPARLKTLVESSATRQNITGLGNVCPVTFTSQLGQYPFNSLGFFMYASEDSFGEQGLIKNFYPFTSLSFSRPDGTTITYGGLGSDVYGAVFYPLTGRIYKATYYPSYSGQSLRGPWLSAERDSDHDAAPATGEKVIDFGTQTLLRDIDPEIVLEVKGSNSLSVTTAATVNDRTVTTDAYMAGSYFTGSLPSSVISAGNGLQTGKTVVYSLAESEVSTIDRTTISLIKASSVSMTTNVGSITTTLSGQLPEIVSLGGAGFRNVAFEDTLVFDGITGAVEKNGVNVAATTDFIRFPSLTPGENVVDAQIGTVTVEYYPTYI